MASTFKFHSSVGEVVPWNATYTFPTQSTQVTKSVVKIPAKNGDSFKGGQIMRIELPAEGYLNPQNSVLQLDVTVSGGILPRGGAHNLIQRVRIMYGSMVLEDIPDYKTIVRIFTECGIQSDYNGSSGAILEGQHACTFADVGSNLFFGGHAASSNISTIVTEAASAGTAHVHNVLLPTTITSALEMAAALSGDKRTYCLSLLCGLLTTKKLIPLKWMASQLALEITFASNNDALLGDTAPDFTVESPNFIAELVEFDSSYDKAFYMGLQQGIPIKFSSWHTHRFAMTGANQTFQIHERSRSVKAAFAVAKSSIAQNLPRHESDFFYHALAHVLDGNGTQNVNNATSGQIQEFQWRVGGRYYPSQPVRATFGGAEAYVELMKTINYLGNHTVASGISPFEWTSYRASKSSSGGKFIMACEFENTDVLPDQIAGINAEEQSDIALTIRASAAPTSKELFCFVHYDALLIVKTGNAVELVM